MTNVIKDLYDKRKEVEKSLNKDLPIWGDPLEITRKVAFKYYKCLNTPIALSCFLLLKYEEYDQLVTKSVHPIEYNSIETFEKDYSAVKFLSKCAGLPTTINTRLEALKSEAWAEAKCKRTNMHIAYLSKHITASAHPHLIERTRKIISRVLGETPTFDDLISEMRFGPGSSSATTTMDTTIVAKVGSDLHVTSKALMDLQYAVQVLPMLDKDYVSHNFIGPLCGPRLSDIRNYATWMAVPKSAKTDRGIKTPIHGLMLGQKAIGNIIRRRMRTNANIDLNYLWKVNQVFAEVGSKDDFYTTFDFKSASSTIAAELPFFLLPRSWALLLDRWREEGTSYDGVNTIDYKFSAMGNGYTFELESLIFWAMAQAVADTLGYGKCFVSSFGDDVILPTPCASLFQEFSSEMGLVLNTSKSFSSTPFRESCGGDFWLGCNVTPVYLKGLIKDETACIKLLNRIRRKSCRYGDDSFCDIQLKPVWLCLMDLLKQFPVSTGGFQYGDTVIWAHPAERKGFTPIYYAGAWYTITYGLKTQRRRHSGQDRLVSAISLQTIWDQQVLLSTKVINLDLPSDIKYNLNYRGSFRSQYRLGFDYILDMLSSYTSLPRTMRGTTNKRVMTISMSDVLDIPPPWL